VLKKQKKVKVLGEISSEDFDKIVSAIKKSQDVKVYTWTCEVCNVTFASLFPSQLEQWKQEHLLSKRHIRRCKEGKK